jgi:hypothetical protein
MMIMPLPQIMRRDLESAVGSRMQVVDPWKDTTAGLEGKKALLSHMQSTAAMLSEERLRRTAFLLDIIALSESASSEAHLRLVNGVFPADYASVLTGELLPASANQRTIAVNYWDWTENVPEDVVDSWLSLSPQERAGHDAFVEVAPSGIHHLGAPLHGYLDVPKFCASVITCGNNLVGPFWWRKVDKDGVTHRELEAVFQPACAYHSLYFNTGTSVRRELSFNGYRHISLKW